MGSVIHVLSITYYQQMVYTIHLHFYLLEITRLQVYICQIMQMIVTLHNASIYIGEEIYSIIPVQTSTWSMKVLILRHHA